MPCRRSSCCSFLFGWSLALCAVIAMDHLYDLKTELRTYCLPAAAPPSSLGPRSDSRPAPAYRAAPSLSHRQLMALGSTFDPALHNYTAVIGAWRRPQYIGALLDALCAQTLPPAEIWVSIFASPRQSDYLRELSAHAEQRRNGSAPPVLLIVGEPQLGYYGRFQLALQVRTTHAWVLDDDVRPGRKVARSLMHMSHAEPYRGIYGFKGFHLGDTQRLHIDPSRLLLANLVGGFWFMRSEYVKLMFREDPVTWLTGEDYHLSHMARKHEALPTWVYPHDPDDRETSGIRTFEEYMQWSNAGDTTLFVKDGRLEARQRIEDFVRRSGWWD